MPGLREKFANGLEVQAGQKLDSAHDEFLEVFNTTLSFHDAEVVADHLSVEKRRLDLSVHYVLTLDAGTKPRTPRTRLARLSMELLTFIELSRPSLAIRCTPWKMSP